MPGRASITRGQRMIGLVALRVDLPSAPPAVPRRNWPQRRGGRRDARLARSGAHRRRAPADRRAPAPPTSAARSRPWRTGGFVRCDVIVRSPSLIDLPSPKPAHQHLAQTPAAVCCPSRRPRHDRPPRSPLATLTPPADPLPLLPEARRPAPRRRHEASPNARPIRPRARRARRLDILLCAPRGFCAGVDRAVQIVELALERFGAPCLRAPRDRPQPLRRRFALKAKGAVFVEELDEVPPTPPSR